MEEIIKTLERQTEQLGFLAPLDIADWRSETGVIITFNQAKQILEFLLKHKEK